MIITGTAAIALLLNLLMFFKIWERMSEISDESLSTRVHVAAIREDLATSKVRAHLNSTHQAETQRRVAAIGEGP